MQIKVKELKKAYEEAVKKEQEQFTVKDIALVTSYAKYLLEYITRDLKLSDDMFIELQQKQTEEKNV